MNELSEVMNGYVDAQFKRLSDDRDLQKKVADKLFNWLANKARKKPVPDLEQRLETWKERIKHLSENLEFRFEGERFVVTCAGSAEDTLKRLRLGSDWFDGTEDVVELIGTALFKTNSVSI